jgi:hypothetical protein
MLSPKFDSIKYICISIYLPGEDEGDNIIPDNLRQAIDHCKHSNVEFVGGGDLNAHSFQFGCDPEILEAKKLMNSFYNKA